MKKRIYAYNIIMVCLLLLIMIPAIAAKSNVAPGDLQYERKEGGDPDELKTFPPSIFPHWIHRIHFRCDACHDSLFEMKRGATPVTKDLMKAGKVCGACHNGKQAFSAGFENCNRCHVAEKK